MKKPTPAELEQMADARCTSLIRRWLVGKKLNDEDKAFIAEHGHIPAEILDKGPSSPGAKEAVSGALNTRKHFKFNKKLPEYEPTFETGERGIRYWIRRGKLLGKKPPLDEPEKMADWWRQCMDQEVPDKLLAYEKIGQPVGSGDPPATNGDKRSEENQTPKDYSNVTSLDIAENVEALRCTHAINKNRLDDALAGTNETETQLRQKNFERSFELLRKGELALVQIQKERGNLIDIESVRSEIAQAAETLQLSRETMGRNIMAELEKILPRKYRRVLRLIEKYLLPSIDKARATEDDILRNLDLLRGPQDVKEKLELQAA